MNQTIRKELLAQLQHLRTETKEISRLYAANLQRDIVQLIEFVNENPGGAPKKPTQPNQVLSEMKATLDEITLKPEKGRRKDLRRIERAIRSMKKLILSEKRDA